MRKQKFFIGFASPKNDSSSSQDIPNRQANSDVLAGEIVCAYAAGFLTATDAVRIAYYRGFHAHLAGGRNGEKGAMMAV